MEKSPKTKEDVLRSRAAVPGRGKNKGRKLRGKSLRSGEASPRAGYPDLRLLAGFAEQFRAPLRSVLAMNRALLETHLSAAQRNYAEKTQASVDSFLNVLNDILDYSGAEAGKLALQQIDFDLRTTVEATAHMLAIQARQKGLELACLIHHDVPSLLIGDPGRLRQILSNLAGQSLKFTEKGEMLIQVTLEKETKTLATVHFAVMDTGRSISPGIRSSLFQFAPRRDSSSSKVPGDRNIGLALSKKLVEMMGGEMDVESRKGQGSTFWFTTILRKQKPEAKRPWAAAEKIEGQRVLIVDENETSREILREQLRAWGCLPEEAAGGKEAWAKLLKAAQDNTPFSLAILNKEMKEIDGITIGRQIKENPALSSTILVLMTSQGNRGEAKLTQAVGFAAYLTKPVRSSQLRDCLAIALSRKAIPAPPGGVPLITRYSLVEEKKRRIRILLAEDDPAIQKVGLQILQKIGYGADAVGNGQEVLAALERASYDLILMDGEMPMMDGFLTTSVIRREEKGKGRHIPIIGMTGQTSKVAQGRCLEVGMDDYIFKPIQAIDIADILERFFPEEELAV